MIRAIDNRAIGNAADLIWKFIGQKSQPVKLSTIRKNIPLSYTFLMAGIGWLAKEDKLTIDVELERSDDPYSYRVIPKQDIMEKILVG